MVALLLILVLPVVSSYNNLVDKDQAVDTQFANVDTQLQRRFDLIPGLVAAVRAALEQEQEVFGQIAEARTRYAGAGSVDERVEASNQVESALARLLVIMENYPQLQSNERVRDFMVQLEGTENRIAQERRDYNTTVNDYNRTVRRFPSNITAGIFGFDKRPTFAADADEREPPDINFDDPTPRPTAG